MFNPYLSIILLSFCLVLGLIILILLKRFFAPLIWVWFWATNTYMGLSVLGCIVLVVVIAGY